MGGLALLAGEPGIGKSSLAADAAATAASGRVVSLWATCWQGDGTPPFWPWVQVLRQVRREVPAAEVARAFSPVASALGPLAAELDLGEGEEGGERFRVFDAMTRGLLELAATTPLLIVLDDLHWADAPSLQLLDFLGRNVRHAAVLVIGTYRDVDLPDDHPLHGLVGLAASQVAHLQLAGLDADAVAEMLTRTSHEPSRRIPAATRSSCVSSATCSPAAPTTSRWRRCRTTSVRSCAIESSGCRTRRLSRSPAPA
jgi:predicted ATPase